MNTILDVNHLAGRDLDSVVAIEVMGWKPVYLRNQPLLMLLRPDADPDALDSWRTPGGLSRPCGWSPSEQIDDAFEVVHLLHQRGWSLDLKVAYSRTFCTFYHSTKLLGANCHSETRPSQVALAIARAAVLVARHVEIERRKDTTP
jgi:hypothetical protein